jgi:predicted alpha/beta-hydrolase family hydrolase
VAAKEQVDLDYIATGAGRPSVPWTEHAPLLRAPTLVLTGDRDVLVAAEGPSGGPNLPPLTGLRSFRV